MKTHAHGNVLERASDDPLHDPDWDGVHAWSPVSVARRVCSRKLTPGGDMAKAFSPIGFKLVTQPELRKARGYTKTLPKEVSRVLTRKMSGSCDQALGILKAEALVTELEGLSDVYTREFATRWVEMRLTNEKCMEFQNEHGEPCVKRGTKQDCRRAYPGLFGRDKCVDLLQQSA